MDIRSSKFLRSTKAFGCYFLNRLKGVEYGKAVLNETKVRIVPTVELEKFIEDIGQYGFPRNGAVNDMSLEKANELMRRIKPIITSDKKIVSGNTLIYCGMNDRFQLYDRKKHAQRLFVMTRAPHPTRDFWRYIKNNILPF